ncbi:DUF3298 and DUF4163 domain-containing protein [Alkalihalobacillus oceani]|uniref:DUF3298 and DUF4163 domain-containing protein n=1 Tax=Halalkalibacter oceani TaxID=1653776 RepID=A0A9X2DLM2_9BACI|nr:DUF3298 and DUF4163 domain-containing protein [Halalkalibacter oceani]MCM3712518.1 DUF3298 and DUF4163 domain-containing protein [Halalkalibacter oceani]
MNTWQLPVQVIARQLVQPRLDIYYPELSGLANQQVQEKLNRRIVKQVMTMIKKQGYEKEPQTVITGGFEVKTNQRDIISLTNNHYAYSGGAHGLTIQRSLTMNTVTGDIYTLKDLFKPGANYSKALNAIIRRQIKERDLPLLTEFKGIAPNQYFYIADKALVLYFQLYELLPYAAGIPYFVIPVYELEHIVAEDGPLGRMIG